MSRAKNDDKSLNLEGTKVTKNNKSTPTPQEIECPAFTYEHTDLTSTADTCIPAAREKINKRSKSPFVRSLALKFFEECCTLVQPPEECDSIFLIAGVGSALEHLYDELYKLLNEQDNSSNGLIDILNASHGIKSLKEYNSTKTTRGRGMQVVEHAIYRMLGELIQAQVGDKAEADKLTQEIWDSKELSEANKQLLDKCNSVSLKRTRLTAYRDIALTWKIFKDVSKLLPLHYYTIEIPRDTI